VVKNTKIPLITLTTILTLASVSNAPAGNMMVTVNGPITSASDGVGSAAGQAVAFSWVVNDYAPQTPNGIASCGQYRWAQETDTEPQLWASVGGTGIGGTFTSPPGGAPWERWRIERVIRNDPADSPFELLMNTDSFDVTQINHGILLSAAPTFPIKALYFNGRTNMSLPAVHFPSPVPNPATVLESVQGTYDVVRSRSGQSAAIDGRETGLGAELYGNQPHDRPGGPGARSLHLRHGLRRPGLRRTLAVAASQARDAT
jgi:hypothetical protein